MTAGSPLDLVQGLLPSAARVLTPSKAVGDALAAAGTAHRVGPVESQPDHSVDALALCDGELSEAGDKAEVLIDEAARVLRPGGLFVATTPSTVHALATGTPTGGRAFTATQLADALHHRGFEVVALRGRGVEDPTLADGAPVLEVASHAPASEMDRSRVFFQTLPTKLLAAAVVCQDGQGRLLLVHDAFKNHWTIPGGVVDANEDPRVAARREAWEEAGVRVEVGALLAAYHGLWPDRLHLLYEAVPLDPEVEPDPVHTHEATTAQWLPRDEALARMVPHMAARVRPLVGR